MRISFSKSLKTLMAATMLLSVAYAVPAYAAMDAVDEKLESEERPRTLREVENLKPSKDVKKDEGLPFDIREEALREAALSFGARSGLSYRIYQIRQELSYRARYLDKVYDFGQLLIPAPSGLMIEPPIVSSGDNALIIEANGQQAAVSDKIYHIIANARIVSAPRSWRFYLERSWGEVELPPDLLLPETEEERQIWIELVNEGWEYGIQQANDIFEADLNRLVADFQGMIRYRTLLTQGMISPPYALQVDRGITGGPNEMRVGDRAIEITGVPQLITGSEQWQPASR